MDYYRLFMIDRATGNWTMLVYSSSGKLPVLDSTTHDWYLYELTEIKNA